MNLEGAKDQDIDKKIFEDPDAAFEWWNMRETHTIEARLAFGSAYWMDLLSGKIKMPETPPQAVNPAASSRLSFLFIEPTIPQPIPNRSLTAEGPEEINRCLLELSTRHEDMLKVRDRCMDAEAKRFKAEVYRAVRTVEELQKAIERHVEALNEQERYDIAIIGVQEMLM